MKTSDDFLVEIGTEELPSKSLLQVATNFANKIEQELVKAEFSFDDIEFFASPRRFGVYVKEIASIQKDRVIEKFGPSRAVAFDQDGNPTQAALGFAKSCQINMADMMLKETDKGECLYHSQTVKGESIVNIAPIVVKQALNSLPIAKPMLWGNHSTAFIRPVHWLLMMYGKQIIPCELFDLNADNRTYGHRFHHPDYFFIEHPTQFMTTLKEQGYVIANFNERKEMIRSQILELTPPDSIAIIDEALLDEVTGIVEWPVALLGNFEHRFLDVPQEALISAMKFHQKSFHLVNKAGYLLPHFITVANIESKDPDAVIVGNERVMRARLSDAEFFYHSDLKTGLETYLQQLKTVVFQNKLGTLYDKAIRISKLAGIIAEHFDWDETKSQRAGLLCKADLSTEMVGEFPELQGIMGYYYAIANKEPSEVAVAIKEHYLPRFSGDIIPSNSISCAVALADKVDTLIGIFGINQAPTGEKDPFGLRRLAVAVLRILIENQLPYELKDLLKEAVNNYAQLDDKENVVENTLAFIMDRLRSWYLEQAISADVHAAVFARYPTSPLDFDMRVKAVQEFQKLPEAEALASANKRVSNILKQTKIPPHNHINYALLELPAEKELATIIENQSKQISDFCQRYDYQAALTLLAKMQQPIDQFFDQVMVMVEDEQLRNNRLILLNNLRQLFLQIADISLLQA